MRATRLIVSALAVVMCASSARADIIGHNGYGSVNGSQEVPVYFASFSEPGALFSGLGFFNFAAHQFTYEYEAPYEPPVVFLEVVVQNLTGIAWTGFEVDLQNADFFGLNYALPGGPLANDTNPVTFNGIGPDQILYQSSSTNGVNNTSVASSSIERRNNGATLSMEFEDTVANGEWFRLGFMINDVDQFEDYFVMTQSASHMPAPAGHLLALVGLALVGRIRRRHID